MERAIVVEVLWQQRDPRDAPLLEAALNDAEPDVWKQALDGLVTLGARATLEAALESIDSSDSRGAWLREAITQVDEHAAGAAEIPYTNRELSALAPGELPTRGRQCPKCRALIPEFADLSWSQLRKLNALLKSRKAKSVQYLQELTGCPQSWAKAWVSHQGPRLEPNPPCPKCSAPLRSRVARQCFACGAAWHSESNE